MKISELVLGVLLAYLILFNVKLPDVLRTVPGTILILAAILYLFVKSPVLGVLALIAGFMSWKPSMPMPADVMMYKKEAQMPVSLEETVIQNMVPMVKTPELVKFANSVENTHNAASAS